MRKKTIMITGGLVILAFAGFGVFQAFASSASPDYSKADVKEVINAQYPGEVSEPQLNEKEGYYEAFVERDGNKYNVKIDANTGDVVGLEMTEKGTVNNAETKKKTDTNKSATEEKEANIEEKKVQEEEQKNENEKNQATNSAGEQKKSEGNVTVSLEKAKEIALARFPGKVDEAELDEDDGRYLYEIKIINGNEEAELDVDAFTGEILYQNIEVEDDD
ncbi:PepSY domain-containing protein [Oceanobacillus kapialis]|uniref:PepSY domain-containing protein n=1 Tax=Oceanobacillus kapialis TaxID=481353 RepID=UPI00384C49DC